ncbi:ABC transporter substrate-binding protein [Limobrevibacterium gyesilva]|uniref:ABC transporter substrate-binding protein n=1 Tax=Limobrevibacterium gyesilva TaxID=2991712 RepID=A0AA42CHS0_9PROT|nr:ABC transporter substrate-binding protein [Limobrevibacterium gyesilva]MCW3475262.1 ABC transporter substrate-binding protein [Limobrevibacterium gyesilva]
MKDMVAAWEAATGNKVALTFYNGSDLPAKIISAMTTGEVPDICYVDNGDFLLLPQAAWNDKLVDVSDVVETQKPEYNQTALTAARLYNNVAHKRSDYGVPLKQQALHYEVWRPMIERAGYKDADIPAEWNAYFKFFEDVHKKLRAKGERVYGLGYSLSTRDSDSTYLFNQFLVAYGGGGIVTPDGKLHADDPQVRKAAIDALTALTTPYKEGYVPPGAINWGDPDNNNAFYAKQIVMTPNATISIAVAQMEKTEQYYHEIITMPQPNGPDGKPVTSLVSVKLAFVPKGAPNVDAAKDFLKYLIQPKNLDTYLAQARGRWLPVMPSIVKGNPFWTDPKDPHRPVAVKQELDGPTMPWFQAFNPAYADVNAQQIWGTAEASVMQNRMTPDKAVDAAFQQIKAAFAKYPEPAE